MRVPGLFSPCDDAILESRSFAEVHCLVDFDEVDVPLSPERVLASACCIASPFFRDVFLSRSPLTCCGEQLTLETFNIHVRACPAISGGGMKFPCEGFSCRAENRILGGFSHRASCGRRSAYASFRQNSV